MILRRYVLSAVMRPFLGTLVFLVAIYGAWAASKLISAGGAVSMTPSEFFTVIGLQTQVALEVLVPFSLFLAIITGLGQLAATQEALAIRANGGGDKMLFSSVAGVGLLITLIIGVESLWLRPQAYEHIYTISTAIDQDIDFSRIEGGKFYISQASQNDQGGRVIFADRREDDTLYQVFVAHTVNGRSEFIFARDAVQQASTDGDRVMDFTQGYLYQLVEQSDASDDWHLAFDEMRFVMPPPANPDPGNRRKSTSTEVLSKSAVPFEIAEYQGRFGAPLTTLLLALLAIPLSRFAPRSSRYGRMLVAVVFVIVYYSANSLARTWMESGVISLFPGVFWPQLLLVAVFVGLVMPTSRPRAQRFGRR